MGLKLAICLLFVVWIPSWSFMVRSSGSALRPKTLGSLRTSSISNAVSGKYRRHGVRSALSMAVKTYLSADSSFEARCSSLSDENVSLSEYMRLPVEQYACLKMPLNASLKRINNRQFKLVIPSVKLFHLDVSPIMICDVVQTPHSVEITSNHCTLSGSDYVDGLNGCFQFDVVTKIQWIDTPTKSSIQSFSKISLAVDPPHPFKFVGKKILESTGMVALNAIMRQIEGAFVHSLAEDYERWAKDPVYRVSRSKMGGSQSNNNIPCSAPTNNDMVTPAVDLPSQVIDDIDVIMKNDLVASQTENVAAPVVVEASVQVMTNAAQDPPVELSPLPMSSSLPSEAHREDIPKPSSDSSPSISPQLHRTTAASSPPTLSSWKSTIVSEPIIRVEVAPLNSRRIFAAVDVLAHWDLLWKVLTDYKNLSKVVPSLLQNEVLQHFPDGGARLMQVGGAKILPGLTFKAKTVLDVRLYDEHRPIPDSMLVPLPFSVTKRNGPSQGTEYEANYAKIPLRRGIFPRPHAIKSIPHRDITMQNVPHEGGDFEHYQGIWRVQGLSGPSEGQLPLTRLSYAVEIKPRGMLPVNMIENRIASDLKANLEAIRREVQRLQVQHRAAAQVVF